MTTIPRLRMFAGPNGSGKSTLKSVISPALIGVYVNPDEIEKEILATDSLDLRSFGVQCNTKEILNFFLNSALLAKADLLGQAAKLQFSDDKLSFFSVSVNAYFASVAADFIRQKLLEIRISFTVETVMSASDKVLLLQNAQQHGYRTYLYFIATEDPIINISRVRHRVKMGGHPVPEDKIVSRYYRSLDLLCDAVRFAHRSYIFDNSGGESVWIAEITDGKVLDLKTPSMPHWFKTALWDRFDSSST